jgi:hypothetical protein
VRQDSRGPLELVGPYLLAKYRDYGRDTWGQDKVMPDNENFTRSFEELIEGRFILGPPDDATSS